MTLPARFLALALYGLALIGTASASQQEELENLRKRIASMQLEMDRTSETKSEVSDSLRESERAISNSNRKLSLLAAHLSAADSKLNSLQAEQRALTAKVANQQSLFGRLLYQQYLGGQREYLKLLLDNRDPGQALRELQYYQYIARARAAWLASLRNDLVALDQASKASLAQRAELASLRLEQAAQMQTLRNEKHARQLMLARISSRLRRQHREISHLQRDENRLSQLVDRIAKVLAQPKSGTLFRNDNLPDSHFDGRPFEQLKGKLTLPVRGVVTNRFGALHADSPVQWKGLFVKSASGQPVKAIAAGRVVFADWLRGFGNLLIIDHGDGYMSLYANNETLYRQVGDVLHGGDTVAAVGNSGGNEDFGLYFELRHQSKPFDPMSWMATR